MRRWVIAICVGWVVLIVLATVYGCTAEDVQKYPTAWVRNFKLCDDRGGRKDITWNTDHAVVECHDGHQYKVWYWAENVQK